MPSNSMNAINFNRGQLTQRDRFKHVLGGYTKKRKTEYTFPKATTSQLKALRKRLKEERQIRMLKVVALSIILIILLFSAILYSTDGIVELFTY